MLIRGATLRDGSTADAFIRGGRVVRLGRDLSTEDAEVLEAAGGLLLPGLHDHHIHVAATAAGLSSVRCGPPEVWDEQGLARALGVAGAGWLRGIGYHESVAGDLDRRTLDGIAPTRPVRVQHRSGRMWIFNSAGLETLLACGLAPPAGLDRATGRLFEGDAWLRTALGSAPPDLAAVGRLLARAGVTGLTDLTPTNDDAAARHFSAERERGALPQRAWLAGRPELSIAPGPVKLHLHEAALPEFDAVVGIVRDAHRQGRVVAVHCVTEVELVFTLAALRAAGSDGGDRIEHASVATPELVGQMRGLGVVAVVQPNFVAERGDAYRRDIAAPEWPNLYRLRSLAAAGVPLAGGTDAPFGRPDPWAAMAAAVTRATQSGAILGAEEALTPEEALDLFLADPADLARTRTVAAGMAADLCLLDRPWQAMRGDLSAARVRATIIGGRRVHDGVDQPPG